MSSDHHRQVDIDQPRHLLAMQLAANVQLTGQEQKILYLYELYSVDEVAEMLVNSKLTIKNHLANIRAKLDVESMVHAVKLASVVPLISADVEEEMEVLIRTWWQVKRQQQAQQAE